MLHSSLNSQVLLVQHQMLMRNIVDYYQPSAAIQTRGFLTALRYFKDLNIWLCSLNKMAKAAVYEGNAALINMQDIEDINPRILKA